jgi:hypothetical protein
MEIRSADPARDHSDQQLPRRRFRHRHVPKRQRTARRRPRLFDSPRAHLLTVGQKPGDTPIAILCRMIEILDNLRLLSRPHLDPRTLSLAGVPYGAKASDAIDRHKIIEVGSPIVQRMVTPSGAAPEFYDREGRRLSFAELIDNVFEGDGSLHFADRTSYKVAGGRVVGFALYGAEGGYLSEFSFLGSYGDFLELFGPPDLVEENIDFGELMGYRNFYWYSSKQAYWDSWDEQLTLVNLGAFDGNNRPKDTRGR